MFRSLERRNIVASKSRHVTPWNEGWANKKAGNQRATSVHSTQAAAQQAARQDLAKQGGGELVTHNKQGQIRQKNTISPAKDPYPPRG